MHYVALFDGLPNSFIQFSYTEYRRKWSAMFEFSHANSGGLLMRRDPYVSAMGWDSGSRNHFTPAL